MIKRISQYVALAVAASLGLIFTSHPVNAGEREHGDTQNPFDHYHKNMRGEDTAKGILAGAVLTCAVVSLMRGKWCLEGDKSEPTTPTGPTPRNDVTPDRPAELGLYK